MGIASGSRFYFVQGQDSHICISYKKNSVAHIIITRAVNKKRGKSVIIITRAVNKKKSLTRPGLKCTASAKNVVVS